MCPAYPPRPSRLTTHCSADAVGGCGCSTGGSQARQRVAEPPPLAIGGRQRGSAWSRLAASACWLARTLSPATPYRWPALQRGGPTFHGVLGGIGHQPRRLT